MVTDRSLHRHTVADGFLRRHLPHGSGVVIDVGASENHEYEDNYRATFKSFGYEYKPGYLVEGWDLAQRQGCKYTGIFCSHVLEHIPNDEIAAKYLWSMAGSFLVVVLPIADEHIEYGEARQEEWGHVRRYSIERVLSLFPDLPDACEVEDVISFLPSGESCPFDNWQIECLWVKEEDRCHSRD